MSANSTLQQQLRSTEYTLTLMDDGSAVLLDMHQETLMTLNASAALIVQCLQQGLERQAIIERLLARFQVSNDSAAADVDAFLLRLQQTLQR